MSIDALNWAKTIRVGDAKRKSVLMVLADYADEMACCFPSQARIAREAEVPERTVRLILREFTDRHIIALREHRPAANGRGRSSDLIHLNLSWGDDQAAAAAARKLEFYRQQWDDQAAAGDDQAAVVDRLTGRATAREPVGNGSEEPVENFASARTKTTCARCEDNSGMLTTTDDKGLTWSSRCDHRPRPVKTPPPRKDLDG